MSVGYTFGRFLMRKATLLATLVIFAGPHLAVAATVPHNAADASLLQSSTGIVTIASDTKKSKKVNKATKAKKTKKDSSPGMSSPSMQGMPPGHRM
jgi:hypothetical protein